jgi:hypothetical protein
LVSRPKFNFCFSGITNSLAHKFPCEVKHRLILMSFRDFRLLRYSSRYGHAEGEHVNRGKDTPSLCPTLQFLDMSNLGETPNFCPTLQFLDMSNLGDAADVNPANSKTHNAFVFPVHAMFRHDCPLAVKSASTPRRLVHKKKKKKKTWRASLPIDMLLSAVSVLVAVQPS